jgi:hypothetical protein
VGDTAHSTLPLTVIHCHFLGIHIRILLSLLPLSGLAVSGNPSLKTCGKVLGFL